MTSTNESFTHTIRDLARFRDKHGLLGCFTHCGEKKVRVIYYCENGDILCAKCANEVETATITMKAATKKVLESKKLIGGGVYHYGPPVECDGCKRRMTSIQWEKAHL